MHHSVTTTFTIFFSCLAEEYYPYMNRYNGCGTKLPTVRRKISLYYKQFQFGKTSISEDEINQIKSFVAVPGALMIAINGEILEKYRGGVFVLNGPSQDANHAVNLVGYEIVNGQECWVIRNSWGPQWGDGGYINIAIKPSRNGIDYRYILTLGRCTLLE